MRKSREPRMRAMASSLGFAISPTSDLAGHLHLSEGNTSPWVASKMASGGQRDGSGGEDTCFLAAF